MRVLIVDDSVVMRELLRRILAREPGIEVVGTAPDPIAAEERIPLDRPDVLTLDIEMPRMDGITFLERLMHHHPMPVVMVSSLTHAGCEATMRALELGAVDFVAKPGADVEEGLRRLAPEIVRKVRAAAQARVARPAGPAPSMHVVPKPASLTPFASTRGAAPVPPPAAPHAPPLVPPAAAREPRPPAVPHPLAGRPAGALPLLAIGASTGGTEAILEVLRGLPADAPPTVMVQHMPPGFTRAFAARLDRMCAMRVKEAEDGDALETGLALLAPGDRHMRVERDATRWVVRLSDEPPVGYHKPAVDVLFESCAERVGDRAVGVVLTGMGADGAAGLLAMRRAGARTVAQDEATSVVYGMPRDAHRRGGAEFVEPLGQVAGLLLRLFAELRGSGRSAA